MKTIDPRPGRIKELLGSVDADKPIVMINLLKFNDQANYPADADHAPCTGAQAYDRYSETATLKVEQAGGSMAYLGRVLGTLIAPEDEEWDKAIVVRYPSFNAFLSMVMAPDYQAATIHRTASLLDSRLIMAEEETR